MFKANKKQTLLLIILAFAFVYRITLLLWQTYPPGADIGFHASVINSITRSGNTDFLWNFYQMGGGVELEFPGYHIFASMIIAMTGLPSYFAQATIVALFSSLIVLAVFLVTRTILSETTAFIAAVFVAISRFDIEMLSWGGQPNIIALLLIPLFFYLFLKRDKFGTTPFLVSTSFLVAALFLTHSLSAAVFIGITVITSFAVLFFPKLFKASRKNLLYLALPIFIGAMLVSPFLARAAQPYLNDSAAFTGATAIEQAMLAQRMVPFGIVLALFACTVLFFFLLGRYKRQLISFPLLLLVMWLLVPLLLTQSYVVGLYLDYIRFLYFLITPLIILFAAMVERVSEYFARVLCAFYGVAGQRKKISQSVSKLSRRIQARLSHKTVRGTLIVGLMLILIYTVPLFLFPWEGFTIRNYYQVMNNASYQAIQWAKQNTPEDSVFVSDFYYGWWLGGFAQRPTLAAVDLQYLTLAREVNIAKNASYLLDTDYVIDNGYVQVREDGGYVGRHNPLFLADLNWTNYPYGFFQFNSSEITLLSHDENGQQCTNLSKLPVTCMQLVGSNSNSPSIVVDKANSDFSYSEIVTVTKGNLFANMTIIVQNNNSNMSLDWLNVVIDSQGIFQQSFNNTLAILDPDMKLCGQLIFAQAQPIISNFNPQSPCITQLAYSLQCKSRVEIQILVGIFPVSEKEIQNPTSPSGLKGALSTNLQNPATSPDLPITTFDYKVALQEYNVSYVANRDFELNPKYVDAPDFRLVFMNDEVAIFKVESTSPNS